MCGNLSVILVGGPVVGGNGTSGIGCETVHTQFIAICTNALLHDGCRGVVPIRLVRFGSTQTVCKRGHSVGD